MSAPQGVQWAQSLTKSPKDPRHKSSDGDQTPRPAKQSIYSRLKTGKSNTQLKVRRSTSTSSMSSQADYTGRIARDSFDEKEDNGVDGTEAESSFISQPFHDYQIPSRIQAKINESLSEQLQQPERPFGSELRKVGSWSSLVSRASKGAMGFFGNSAPLKPSRSAVDIRTIGNPVPGTFKHITNNDTMNFHAPAEIENDKLRTPAINTEDLNSEAAKERNKHIMATSKFVNDRDAWKTSNPPDLPTSTTSGSTSHSHQPAAMSSPAYSLPRPQALSTLQHSSSFSSTTSTLTSSLEPPRRRVRRKSSNTIMSSRASLSNGAQSETPTQGFETPMPSTMRSGTPQTAIKRKPVPSARRSEAFSSHRAPATPVRGFEADDHPITPPTAIKHAVPTSEASPQEEEKPTASWLPTAIQHDQLDDAFPPFQYVKDPQFWAGRLMGLTNRIQNHHLTLNLELDPQDPETTFVYDPKYKIHTGDREPPPNISPGKKYTFTHHYGVTRAAFELMAGECAGEGAKKSQRSFQAAFARQWGWTELLPYGMTLAVHWSEKRVFGLGRERMGVIGRAEEMARESWMEADGVREEEERRVREREALRALEGGWMEGVKREVVSGECEDEGEDSEWIGARPDVDVEVAKVEVKGEKKVMKKEKKAKKGKSEGIHRRPWSRLFSH